MKWFRAYHSILDSVKVRTMPAEAQLDFWWLLCLASEYRETTNESTGATGLTIAKAVWRTRSGTLEGTFPLIQENGLATLDRKGCIVVVDWKAMQFKSDDVAARTRTFKEKQALNKGHGAGNVPGNVPGNVRDTETEKNKSPSAPNTAAGTRLAKDWALPKAWGEWALAEKPAWTADDVRRVAATFADHFHAKPGKDGRKADWLATWRNWVRNPLNERKHAIGVPNGKADRRAATVAALTGGNVDEPSRSNVIDLPAERVG